jgi:single-stranded DNA-binding protein
MANLNKIMIIGNVGTTQRCVTRQGTPVTSFRLATSRTYTTPEGERRQETDGSK